MSADAGEYDFEPVPGLPARLPAGESLLWQGAPRWQSLAVHAYHVRGLAAWFVVLLGWRAATLVADGHGAAEVALGCVGPLLLGASALGLLLLLAWAAARGTVYSITNRRLVIRQGIALPTTLNLPFRAVHSAALRQRRGGTGDLVLELVPGQRASYALLWPHVRPWFWRQPQPMLRALPEPEHAASVLATALHAALAEGAGALAEGTGVPAGSAATTTALPGPVAAAAVPPRRAPAGATPAAA